MIYNEGYSATTGKELIERELTSEAIYLARTLNKLHPTGESIGLLALMLIQESRAKSRTDDQGKIIPLEKQNRSLWDWNLITEGLELIQKAIFSGKLGPYTLQAAIASVHATATSFEDTCWEAIIDYYDLLLAITPSAIIRLNRAIAVGMGHGPEKALELLDELESDDKISSYHLLYAAKGEFLTRSGNTEKAIESLEKAIGLVKSEPQKAFLKQKLKELLK